MRLIKYSLSCLLLCLVSTSYAHQTTQLVRYPQAGKLFTKHHSYPIELLKLALSYYAAPIDVKASEYFMNQGRAIKQLKQGKDIEVVWTMTSRDREAEIKPIRIPLYKGLIGWRLFLTTTERLQKPHEFRKLSQLKKTSMIQGHDWPDTEILKYNNFNVASGPNFSGLFQILLRNRTELFPRSIIEVWDELETYESTTIILEPSTLISYPTASYFFVAPSNQALADIIESGLNSAHADGKFNALFQEYYAPYIKKAKLAQRSHFRLVNPLLPKETPLHRKSLWFSLDKD